MNFDLCLCSFIFNFLSVMRIAYVCPRYFPALGGAEEVVKRYAEGMVQRGHDVTVICSDLAKDKGTEKVSAPKEEVINGVKVTRCRAFVLPFFPQYPIYPALFIRTLFSQADIIHLHGTRYFASDAGAVAAKLRGRPFVFNPHAGQFLTTRLGQIHQRLLGWLPFKANAVINVSAYERRLLENSGVCPKKWAHLPNGVDPQLYDWVDFNVYEKFGLTWEPVILSLGRLAPHKGLEVLLKAASAVLEKFPQAKLFLAGRDFGARVGLEALVEKLGIAKSVIFPGGLSEADKFSAFKNATVFCLASRSEAFGIVLIEAMAARLPTVGTDCLSIPEIIDDGQTGYLFPLDDHEALASRLIELLGDDLLRRRLGEAGRRKVEEKYSWPKILDELESLYKELV